MDHQHRIQELQDACPELNPLIIQDFVHRMDPEYFDHFSLDLVIEHLALVGTLTPENPCAITIKKCPKHIYQLTIVAYDYYSEFSMLCGLLSSVGLDIRNATIYTLTEHVATQTSLSNRHRRQAQTGAGSALAAKSIRGLSRKKVVDVFNVKLLPGCVFHRAQQMTFREAVFSMIRLLEDRHFRKVRSHVNRALIETLERLKPHVSDVVHPVEIQFHNDRAPDATVMEIRATDTPAFLYTFANALTMRGVYISKAKIEVKGHTAHNELFVQGRTGGKINDRHEQQELTSTAALIKEFSHFLTWAPDPGKALEHFDQLLDDLQGDQQHPQTFSLLRQQSLLGHLAKLFGSSDFLWEDLLRRQHSNLLPAMSGFLKGPIIREKADLDRALTAQLKSCKSTEERRSRLNTFKDQELFRIDMKHMLDTAWLPDFSLALTNLAEIVLDYALREAQQVLAKQFRRLKLAIPQYSFAIFGLGKLGGKELGYASDIEVLFVYEMKKPAGRALPLVSTDYFEQLVQEILRWIEAKNKGIFHVDTRLRPYGDKGLLANSFEEICKYYNHDGSAAPFERQALIKLRHVAGDTILGEKVETHRDRYVYSAKPWQLHIALGLRTRQIKELVPGQSIHVKYSPGGIIDIEYLTQYLQLMHGHRLSSLRTSNTLEALKTLQRRKILQADEETVLHEDYLFFRQLIDALRIVRGHAQDLVLPESSSDGLIFLARRLGFTTKNWNDGALALEVEIQHRMKRVHKIFHKFFLQKGRSIVNPNKFGA
ncbi:[protein-PII] uridylyltransferase family protein [Candidatus Nitrospira salsa]